MKNIKEGFFTSKVGAHGEIEKSRAFQGVKILGLSNA